MRTRVAVIAVMALALAAGCSSMQDNWDKITGKDRNEREDRSVELNTAGRKRLASLPGLNRDDADRIIANRPYSNRRDLVRKGVLNENKFDKIRDYVYVDHEKN
jgi:DNA uptake protein ComE-like DNA-binding protein